ncbi:MAG: hypothetical protein JSU82_10065 [Rhodospirillales bacterium]|nr:MAG: hypothetical protein JSU82_10065 [Rhodospirillales bacterium]
MTRDRLIQLGWAMASLVVLAVAVGPGIGNFVAAMMANAITVDYPWLLEAGRHLLATRELPETDIFSWTHDDKPWVLYQWLFESGLAAVERAVGVDWLVRLFMLSVITIYLFVPLFGGVPRRVSFLLTAAIGAIALLMVTLNMSIRPGLLTTLFLLTQYMTVDAMRRKRIGRGGVVIIAVMYLLWGNIHLGVMLGPISLTLMLLGDWADGRRLRRVEPADPAVAGPPLPPHRMLVLLAVAVGTSLLNPYGLHIYGRTINVAGQADHSAIVDELQSLDFGLLQGQLLLLCIALFLLALTRHRRTLSTQEILHIAVFTVLAVAVGRMILWAALFYVLILPRALYQLWCDLKRDRPWLRPALDAAEEFRPMILAMLVLFGAGASLVVPHHIAAQRMGLCEPMLPGLREIADLRLPGERMFNDDTSGSCILLVDPGAKVFIDTRFDFYGGTFLAEAAYTMNLRNDWRATFERWHVDSALVARTWPLADALDKAADFEKLFDDGIVAYYRRRGDA